MGRKKDPKYEPSHMLERIEEYIAENTGITTLLDDDGNIVRQTWGVPIYEECLLKNNWSKTRMHELRKENPELDEACEELKTWKAIRLEKGALNGMLDKTMSIFLLKQLGYKENPDAEKETTVKIKLEGAEEYAD